MDDRFDTVTSRAHLFAARHPASYRAAVMAFGVFGYVYLAAVVVLVFAATTALSVALLSAGVGPPVIRVALPPVLLSLLATSALRAAPVPASGLFAARRDAPPLHAVIESLRKRLGTPRIHAVLIGTGLDVRIVRMPRLGSVLGFRNCLMVGLPLIATMPLPYLRALIAQRLSHLCRDRGIEGIRAYRLRDRWLQLANALRQSRHFAAATLRPFFRWYGPWFAAWSLPLARQHQYAADRHVSVIAGREDLIRALVRRGVVERFLVERFYPRLLADLRTYGVPPSGFRRRLEEAVGGIREDDRFRAWLDAAVSRDRRADEHPTLGDRLASLGIGDPRRQEAVLEAAFAPELDGESTTRRLLGTAASELLLSVEYTWVDEIVDEWADRHFELVRWEERRRDLDARADLSPAESLERAIATAEINGTDAALPILHELVERSPDMAPAHFVLGTLLLRVNDPDGLGHLETAMRCDPGLVAHGCDVACEFLRASGRHGEVDAYLARFGAAERPENDLAPVQAAARMPTARPVEIPAPRPERPANGYRHHGLEYPDLLIAKRGIARIAAVARAFLVLEADAPSAALPARAVIMPADTAAARIGGGDQPPFLLAVELMRGAHDPAEVAARRARAVKLPGPANVAVLSWRHRKARRALEAVAEAQLFQRTRRRSA